MAVSFHSKLKNDQSGQDGNRRRKKGEGFDSVLETTIHMEVEEPDIDVHSKGYTRTGAPLNYQVHMHDYTYQKKHA